VQDVPHDRLVRHLGVVGVRVVDGIVPPLAHVCREGLPVVVVRLRIVGLAVVTDELLNKWVGTGRVIGWIREVQNVLNRTMRKANLIFPELKQILLRLLAVCLPHPLSQLPQASLIAHGPFLDRLHSLHGILHRGEGHAAEFRMELLQPLTQTLLEVGAPRFIAGKRQSQTFDGMFFLLTLRLCMHKFQLQLTMCAAHCRSLFLFPGCVCHTYRYSGNDRPSIIPAQCAPFPDHGPG